MSIQNRYCFVKLRAGFDKDYDKDYDKVYDKVQAAGPFTLAAWYKAPGPRP